MREKFEDFFNESYLEIQYSEKNLIYIYSEDAETGECVQVNLDGENLNNLIEFLKEIQKMKL